MLNTKPEHLSQKLKENPSFACKTNVLYKLFSYTKDQ